MKLAKLVKESQTIKVSKGKAVRIMRLRVLSSGAYRFKGGGCVILHPVHINQPVEVTVNLDDLSDQTFSFI